VNIGFVAAGSLANVDVSGAISTLYISVDRRCKVVKANLVEGGEQSFSQEKILTVDKYEII